uniref:Legume lectin domain-containing protein n=1 Tax=Salix viminalis TaxID=40686 RepID=A0A6N2LYE2_SALVM
MSAHILSFLTYLGTLCCSTSNKTSVAERKNEGLSHPRSFLAADVNTQLKNKNITTNIKVDTSSNVEVQYLHEYAAVSSSVGLTVNPTVNFSGVIRTNVASLIFHSTPKLGTSSNAMLELSLSKVELIASLTL